MYLVNPLYNDHSISDEVHVNITGWNFVYLPSYDVQETSYITFRVKGPRDSHAALVSDKRTNYNTGNYYLFVIGGWGNQFCALKKDGLYRQFSIRSDRLTSGYLSDQEFRSFWISWADHNMSLGHGAEVGKSVIFSFADQAAPLAINHLAFGSDYKDTNRYKYYDGKGLEIFLLFTPTPFFRSSDPYI